VVELPAVNLKSIMYLEMEENRNTLDVLKNGVISTIPFLNYIILMTNFCQNIFIELIQKSPFRLECKFLRILLPV